MELSPDTIKKVLQNVKYPGFTRDIVSFGLVKDVQIDGAKVNVSLVLPKPNDKLKAEISDSAVGNSISRIFFCWLSFAESSSFEQDMKIMLKQRSV